MLFLIKFSLFIKFVCRRRDTDQVMVRLVLRKLFIQVNAFEIVFSMEFGKPFRANQKCRENTFENNFFHVTECAAHVASQTT